MTFPLNGVDTFDQPLLDAWWTRGWTSQNLAYLPAPGASNPAGSPTVTRVNITHAYLDLDGSPLGGFLTFMPSSNASIIQSGTTWRLPARLCGTTTISPYTSGLGWREQASGKIRIFRGLLGVTLMQTDAAGLVTDDGKPLTYLVTEHFEGGRQFSIAVPGGSSNPVDLDFLMVADTLQPYVYDPTNILATEGLSVPATRVFTQVFTNVTKVTVVHNLGLYPEVIVLDATGKEVGANVQYLDLNTVVVTFSMPFSGTVVCSA